MNKKILFFIFGLILFTSIISSARLPTVGGDTDSWGPVLNEYLSKIGGPNATELNQTRVNGSNIYSDSINSSHILDGTITGSEISESTNITASWFKGLFNWTTFTSWLIFDGATLSFNETRLNNSIIDYTNSVNTSQSSWIENTFVKLLGGNSINGTQQFNGGWQNGGISIIGGEIFAQTAYLYNLTSLSVSNLNINGSMIPATGFDATFDLGSSSLKWRDIFASRNITTDSYFNGKFNWTTLTSWLSFDGATLSFNETRLNDSMLWKNLTDFANYNGNVIIGDNQNYTEPFTGFQAQGNSFLEIQGKDNTQYGIPVLLFTKKIGTPSSLDNVIGTIIWDVKDHVANSTGQTRFAQITANLNNATDTNSNASYMTFLTRGNTSSVVSEKMRIDSEGRVGIGTTTPSARLHVTSAGNTQTDYTARFQSSGSVGGAGGILFDQNSVFSYKIYTTGTSSTTGTLNFDYINYTNGTALYSNIIMMRNGQVGIGATPSHTLTVNGNANISGGMYVNSTNVGIGTGSPDATLHILRPSTGINLILDKNSTNPQMSYAINGTGRWLNYLEAATGKFKIYDNSLGDVMTFVNGTGYVGIGTASPSTLLTIQGSSPALTIDSNGGGGATLDLNDSTKGSGTYSGSWQLTNRNSDGRLGFYRNGSSADSLVITRTGDVGIGTTSPGFVNTGNSIGSPIHIRYDVDSATVIAIEKQQTNRAPALGFLKSRTGGAVVADADILGSLIFYGHDGTDYVQGATITTYVNGTPGTDDMPGRLAFSTTLDGAAAPTERMTILNNGNVGIGTNGPAQKLEVEDTTSATPLRVQDSSNTCDFGVDGSGWASISCTSDESLKTNIKEVSNEKLQNISDWVFNYPLKEYTWISNNETTIGAVAQDVQILYPEKVETKEKFNVELNETKSILFIEVPTLKDIIVSIQRIWNKLTSVDERVLQLETDNQAMKKALCELNRTEFC